jgi:C_GCAxxG_C_C family probable redox protein
MNRSEIASAKFEAGFNCAQSSFYPFAKDAGLNAKQALKLTTAFGAGMIYRGEMCGAVTGAMMAIGLKFGRSEAEDADAKELTYFLVKELHSRFENEFGSIHCKQLLGLNDVSAESWAKANEDEKFKSNCPLYVARAVEITNELIKKLEDEDETQNS